jgi:hypothetical protein
MKEVFISYRHSDTSGVAGRIFDHLKAQFGEDRLFKDIDSIPMGRDFRTVIFEAVAECKVLLALIGDDWLGADAAGRRRIDDANDYVRLEIEAALSRGIPVIPVLVENATMPKESELPVEIQNLAFRNATRVRHDPDFRPDIERLNRQLAEYISAEPAHAGSPINRRIYTKLAVSLCCLALVSAAATFLRVIIFGNGQANDRSAKGGDNRPVHVVPQTRIEVIDSETKQRIHQRLHLNVECGSRTQLFPTSKGLTEPIPYDFADIKVTGQENLAGYLWNDFPEDDESSRMRTFSLRRRAGEEFEGQDGTFAKAIHPSTSIDWFTRNMDDIAKYHAEMDRIQAKSVELKCQNNTGYYVEVFWYRFAPKALEGTTGFVGGWGPPMTCPPTHGEYRTLLDSVAPEPGGYFYIFGSRNGLKATHLGEGNLFRRPVALLVIDPKQNDEGEDELKGDLSHADDGEQP